MTEALGLPFLSRLPNISRRAFIDAAPLIALFALPILLYVPVMFSPLERDEGVYATIAQRLLRGDVPYRDLFDNKPPLVFGWYALSFLLFGENAVAPRLLAALLLSFTTLAIFAETRYLFTRRIAYISAGAFALCTGIPFVALHANTEAFMLLPLVSSLGAFIIGMRRGRLGWLLLAGALGAIAMMTKQVAIWNLVALAIAAIVWRWPNGGPIRERVAPLLALLLGASAVVAATAIPFVAAGALGDFLYANVSYNWVYARFITLGEEITHMAMGALVITSLAAPLVAAMLLGILLIMLRRRRAMELVLVAWALASALGVASGGRFFPHYFLQLVPAMVLIAAILAYQCLQHPARRRWNPAVVAGALLTVFSLGANAALYLAPVRTEQAIAQNVIYQEQLDVASEALGVYIEDRTAPDDTIFNLGRQSQIYFYADRRPAVPYFYDYAYEYDEMALDSTLDALRQAKPAYIIDSIQPPLFDASQPKSPEMNDFLSQNYDYEGLIFFADVYHLKHAE